MNSNLFQIAWATRVHNPQFHVCLELTPWLVLLSLVPFSFYKAILNYILDKLPMSGGATLRMELNYRFEFLMKLFAELSC